MTARTIRATIYLWTDELPEGADCWDIGSVYIPAQPAKGIKATKDILFNDPGDLSATLLKALKKAGVVVAPSRRRKRG
jgi:hypothetical protein